MELSKQTPDVEKRKPLQQEIQEVNIELERLDRKIISYYDDVDKMTTSIKDSSLGLNNTIKVLFDISLCKFPILGYPLLDGRPQAPV